MTSYVITYRGVKGSPIIDTEYDGTIHNLDDRVTVLEASALASGFSGFSIDTSGHFIVTMNDLSTYDVGVIQTPSFAEMFRGEWTTGMVFITDQLFTAIGSLWAVRWPHTAAATFDPWANDGSGHDYYLRVMGYPVAYGYEITDTAFTPDLIHANSWMVCTGNSCTVTIDTSTDFDPWTELHFRDETLGAMTFEIDTGGTIRPQYECLNTSAGTGSTITLKRFGATSTWDIFGKLASSVTA